MSTKAQGKAKTRKRSVATGPDGKEDDQSRGRHRRYNGHAGLGANAVLAGAGAGALGTGGIVTDNKDPDKT